MKKIVFQVSNIVKTYDRWHLACKCFQELTWYSSLRFLLRPHQQQKLQNVIMCDNSDMMRIQTSNSMFIWFLTGQWPLQSNFLLCFSCHPIGGSYSQITSCAFPRWPRTDLQLGHKHQYLWSTSKDCVQWGGQNQPAELIPTDRAPPCHSPGLRQWLW